jgi:hypothetical protein
MDTVVFGRTGMRVSVAGLVAEGTAASASRTVPVLRIPYSSWRALDLESTTSTPRTYATEQIVGKAVRGRTRRGDLDEGVPQDS